MSAKVDNAKYLIWWTSQEDCRHIGEPIEWDFDDPPWSLEFVLQEELRLPDYLWQQYQSRYGRAGRGRLWVPSDIPVESVVWPDGETDAAECGGIVFHLCDLRFVVRLPGFITDLNVTPIKLADYHREV